MLGKKQSISHEEFAAAFQNIEKLVTKEYLDSLVAETVADIKLKAAGKRVAYAWSGGKDSIALRLVCELAGITKCVFGMTNLEYPAFLRWVTDNMPPGLEVVNTRQDLTWLQQNQEMLFPQDSKTAAKWFKVVQHKAQEVFYAKHNLDILILGRRLSDGNFVGKAGENIYTSKGITRFSPIAKWRHEDIFAAIHYHKLPIPPIYDWPRGFRVGTGPWPARQWTEDTKHGWSEVWQIDKNVVRDAARVIPSAMEFLRCVE